MRNWLAVAPLYYRGEPLASAVNLGDKTVVGPLPDFIRSDAHLDETLSFCQRELIKEARFALVNEYEADHLGEAQNHAYTSLALANLALWLAKPSSAGFEFLVHYEQNEPGGWLHRSYGNYQAIAPHVDAVSNRLEPEDLEQARVLNESLHQVSRPSSVWSAVRLLLKALTESGDWDVRFLHLWVALDALFGADREIRYMISHRMAFFLANGEDEAREIFEQVKAGYGWRNTLAHGGLPKGKQKKDDTKQRGWESEELLRRALNKILLSDHLMQSFSGKGREPYLNDLFFSFSR